MSFLRKAQSTLASGGYSAVNTALEIVRKCLWPTGRSVEVKRVCIYKIGNIGDILCALPAMYGIRQTYPDAHVTLLTSPGQRGMPGAKELLTGATWLDELLVYYADDIETPPQKKAFVRALRRRGFDIWIELPADHAGIKVILRNMLLARLAGAKWAYGWRISTIRWAAQAQSEYLEFPTEVERLLAVVAACGMQPTEAVFPLPLQPCHSQSVEELLREHGLSETPLIAVAPGAKRATNRWPADRFGEVCADLVRRGLQVCLLGGDSDRELCREIAERVGVGAINLAGAISLLESAELLKRCRLLICNDSGVQHLAAAVGTPCLSLFSFWQLRGKWRPYGPRNIVLQKWVNCHTCYLDVCPYDNRCIKRIEVPEVIACVAGSVAEMNTTPGLLPVVR